MDSWGKEKGKQKKREKRNKNIYIKILSLMLHYGVSFLCVKSMKIPGKSLSARKPWQLCWQPHSFPSHVPLCRQQHKKDRVPKTTGKCYLSMVTSSPEATWLAGINCYINFAGAQMIDFRVPLFAGCTETTTTWHSLCTPILPAPHHVTKSP